MLEESLTLIYGMNAGIPALTTLKCIFGADLKIPTDWLVFD